LPIARLHISADEKINSTLTGIVAGMTVTARSGLAKHDWSFGQRRHRRQDAGRYRTVDLASRTFVAGSAPA
jgi:hypothetical protein